MLKIESAQKAIREEGFDGWLFTTHHHRDEIAGRLLGIDERRVNTRPWFYLIPAAGAPRKIVHAIETSILDHLEGTKTVYATRDELTGIFREYGGKRFAVQYSVEIPVISFLDHGTALFLSSCGISLVPSSSLIQRTVGTLDSAGIESHERAARHLHEIVETVWSRIRSEFRTSQAPGLYEADVQKWITDEFAARGLISDALPIVASGASSSDPHYAPSGRGKKLVRGDVLQLDLWAKGDDPAAVYADISWVGVLSETVPADVQAVFTALKNARDAAVSFIAGELSSGRSVSGSAVDLLVRSVIVNAGYGGFIRHRTGHGIDTEAHGSGVNLDGVEFPDSRLILDGACFSVEPGLYLEEFGLRTEINVYIKQQRPVVSGAPPQRDLLNLA